MARKLILDTKDMLVSNLKLWKEKGKLITNPEYQRDYVYSIEQASKLIESALMCIPLPTIYLCEEDDGRYSVIDGQQRIESFIRFIRGDFALKKLTVRDDLNGKKYSELNEEDQGTIDDTALRTIIIRKESADAKFDIFERLNRGAIQLKEQELRNCVFRGSYNQLINELADDKRVKEMFVNENKRMIYQEYILRFFALDNFYSFKGNMKRCLNDYMSLHQNDNDNLIKNDKARFTGTLSIVSEVLGKEAFYNIDYSKKIFSPKFSATFYDSIMIAFSKFDANKLISKRDIIADKILELKKFDDEYHDACYASTGSREKVIVRIQKVLAILQDVLGNNGFIKEPRLFDLDMKLDLAKKQNYICPLCGQKIVNLDEAKIDHIDPYSLGGATTEDNAQLTHKICNASKGNKRESLPNLKWMLDKGLINIGDKIYVAKKPEAVATIVDAENVNYKGDVISRGKFSDTILGRSSNAYKELIVESCGKTLDELREAKMRELGMIK